MPDKSNIIIGARLAGLATGIHGEASRYCTQIFLRAEVEKPGFGD